MSGLPTMGGMDATFRDSRAAGRKLLVPYVTGGLAGWQDAIRAAVANGADGIEVGIPFSDPVMDGPVIQEASERALRDGATPIGIVQALADLDVDVPLAVMTYYNPVYRAGHERFALRLAEVGVAAAIIPDLPFEEAGPWCEAADAAGIETVLLAAPTASDERLRRVVARARGFVYAVGLLGVTGERSSLADSAVVIARRLKAVTDLPVLVGVGISTPEQAVEVCEVADGVVVGSALVRRVLESGADEASADVVAEVVGSFRTALDAG